MLFLEEEDVVSKEVETHSTKPHLRGLVGSVDMTPQRYEYKVEPISTSPDELRNERYTFEDTLNETASEGWILDTTLRIDSSTFLFVFRRPVNMSEDSS